MKIITQKKIKDTFSNFLKKVNVFNTKDRGFSIIANENITKGELVCILGGHVISTEKENELTKTIDDNCLQISDDFAIGIKNIKDTEPACFINHSCNPNCGFKGQIFLVAMKKINKGEEITFDYSMVLSKSKNTAPYKMKCFCGSKNCRKIIDDNGWKDPKIQKKYRGYFQWYLEEKIKKLNK